MDERTILENNAQMNEETIFDPNGGFYGSENMTAQNDADVNLPKKKKDNKSWVNVTLGGVSGILMGAGLMYAQNVYAHKGPEKTDEQEKDPEENSEGKPVDATTPEQTSDDPQTSEVHQTTANPHMAHVGNDLSFGDAFAAARAEVGPGGVFAWHGGVYNTYTAEEWAAMSPTEHDAFIHQVPVAVPVAHIPTVPTDATPHIIVINNPVESDTPEPEVIVVDPETAENFDLGEDVHVVGYTSVDGHITVGYDQTGDGDTDFAIIDVDDNHDISDPDIIVHSDGNFETVADLRGDSEYYYDNEEIADESGMINDYTDEDSSFETCDDNSDDDSLYYTSEDYGTDSDDYVDDALMDV